MVDKKIIIGVSSGVLAIAILLTGGVCYKIHKKHKKISQTAAVTQTAKKQVQPRYVTINNSEPESNIIKEKQDLYSDTPYDIPLISITEICKLSPDIKKTVDSMLESAQGFYFVKQDPETHNVNILLQNPVDVGNRYGRHNLQFAQITPDGAVSYHYVGYEGDEGEISNAVTQVNDVWEFDKSVEPPRPLVHTAYDKDGNVMFNEYWNYSDDEDVKYVMKNAEGKVISIMKEIPDGEMNFRKEHVFYDNDGNTTMSVSANFEGPNIKRFSYYDTKLLKDQMTIESKYSEDGNKTEERIYNNEYKLKATVEASYVDGVRKDIKVLDEDGNTTEEFGE